MKRFFFLFMAGSLALASCQDAPKADEAKTTDAVAVDSAAAQAGATYKVDAAQSKFEWIGTKPTGKHHGTVPVQEGSLTVEHNAITAGKFTLDLKGNKPDDQDSEKNEKLRVHLSGPDFFDVEKYPTAVFEIASVKEGVDTTGGVKVETPGATHTITGNLTMHGVTKAITFPAKVAVTDASVTTDATFNIDRTLWEVGTASTLKSALIKNDVNITLHVVANK